jgi:hypothetical protein
MKALGGDRTKQEEFYFVQLSDTHIGFDGPKVNQTPKVPQEGCGGGEQPGRSQTLLSSRVI